MEGGFTEVLGGCRREGMLRRTDDRRRRRKIGSVDPDIPWDHVMRTEAPRNVRGLSSESDAGCLRNAVRLTV